MYIRIELHSTPRQLKSNINLRLILSRLKNQNKNELRIIAAGSNRISHADPLFAKLAILKIDDLYTQCVRMFSYKLSRKLLPSEVASIFTKVNHSHKTRGASSNLCVGRFSDRSMRTIAPRCWNSLPSALKGSPSMASFKEVSKRSLLAPYASFVCGLRGCPSCVGSAGP